MQDSSFCCGPHKIEKETGTLIASRMSDQGLFDEFAGGKVSLGLMRDLAEAMGGLHSTRDGDSWVCSPEETTNMEPLAGMKERMMFLATCTSKSRAAVIARELGVDGAEKLADRITRDHAGQGRFLGYGNTLDCDSLVDKYLSSSCLTGTGDSILGLGLTLGPVGRDTGLFQARPLACVIAHLQAGRTSEASHILKALDHFWKIYAEKLAVSGVLANLSMQAIYRNAVGWSGVILLREYYTRGSFEACLASDSRSPGNRLKLREAMGAVGLQLIQIGFGPFDPIQTPLERLCIQVKRVIYEESQELEVGLWKAVPAGEPVAPRWVLTELRRASFSAKQA